MDPALLLPFIITGCVAALALSVYRTPLDLQILLELDAGKAQAALTARWSLFSVRGASGRGSTFLSFGMFGKEVVHRETSRSGGITAEGTRERFYLDREVLRYGPGLARIARALIRHLAIRKIEGDAIIGLANPADTGIVYGFFSALRPLIELDGRVSLSLQPVFDREVFMGHLTADLRVDRPLVFPVLVLSFIILPHRPWMKGDRVPGTRGTAS